MKEQGSKILSQALDFVKILTRRLRLIRLNRDFLVFLVFLAISIAFWCMQTLKDTSTTSDDYKLRIVGLPKDYIITSELPEFVKVNVSGRGVDFITYLLSSKEHTLTVNYNDIETSGGKLLIDNATLKRMATKELTGTMRVASITPAQVEGYYTKGKAKRVPIEFKGKVRTERQHVLTNIEVLTKSAEVYAPTSMHDSIKAVFTEPLYLKEVDETQTIRLAIKKIRGAKIIPDSVDVKISVDLFAEKTLSVPIYSKNIPHNKVLRTFPPRAEVKFRVSTNMFDEIKPEDFILLVDFNSIKSDSKDCKVIVDGVPEGVTHVRVDPETVEFVIEQEDN